MKTIARSLSPITAASRQPRGLRRRILAASIGVLFGMLAACPPAKAATRTWDGVTGNPNWTFPGGLTNWTTGVLPVAGDDLQFSAAPINILNNNDFAAGTNFNSITFLGAAGPAYTLNGNAITLGAGGISNLSSATNTISFAGTGITLGASQTWNATNGVLNATSNVDLAGFTLAVDGAQNSTLSGALSSAASTLTKNGTGTLTLSGTNTYTGGTTISAGALRIGAGGTTGSILGNVTNNASLIFDRSNALTFAGVISGTGSLTKNGAGTLTLTGANTYSGTAVAFNGTVVNAGTLTVTGATATITHTSRDLIVGDATLNVSAGAKVSVGSVGVDGGSPAGGFAVVDGAGSKLTAGGSMYIGNFGTGTLTLQNAGAAQAINFNIGSQSGSKGTVKVTGANSVLTATSSVFLGLANTANGKLSVENGGTATITNNVFIGNAIGGEGTTTVTGTGSTLTSSSIFVGDRGTGALNILAGGHATTGSGFIGAQAGSTGTATVSGTGSLWTVNGLMAVGSLGDGTLNIENGATVTNTGNGQVGINGGSHGTVTVSGGSRWQDGQQLSIGNGSVTVSGGSSVTANSGFAGVSSGKTGSLTVTGAGSTADFTSFLQVGGSGTGHLKVLAGGKVTSVGNATVNPDSSTVGPSSTVLVDGVGSSWINNGDLALRERTSMTISGGGLVQNTRAFVFLGGNTVLVTGAGSKWITSEVALGTNSSASLTVADGAVVRVDAGLTVGGGAIFLGDNTVGTGTLNIGAAPLDAAVAAGTINAAVVSAAFANTGRAVVNFNHTDTAYTFAPFLTRNLEVNHYAGTTIVARANTYTGGTNVAGGTLRTQNANALGSGPVALNGGALAVTGTLTASAVSWGAGKLQLAPAAGDILNVTNALTNNGGGGTFSIDTSGAVLGTTYTLATFATTNFLQTDFSLASPSAGVTLTGDFLLNPNDVQLTLTSVTAQGNIIQNAAPVGTPTFANFIVGGQVTTGGPTDNNTVATLAFLPGGSLRINNTLFVTNGPVNLGDGSSIQLNGILSATQLNMFINSLLSGNGGVNGNVVNNGLVSPGNSPGSIRVSGNYTQSSTGALRIEVGGTSQADYDRLIVGGTAKLNGELQLVRLNNFDLKRGDKITFLTAAGGVNGEFATVSNPFTSDTILEPTVVYGDTEVSLELVRGSFAKYAANWGLTPNQRAVASTLDRVSADKPNDKALVYLDGRKLAYLPGDFDKIAPEELTSIFTISTSLAVVQNTNLQRRTDDIRHGASGFSASGLAMQGTGPGYSGSLAGMAGPTGKETKEVVAPAPEEKKWGVFLTGVGEWVDVGGDGNARGYDISTGGFTLGLDYKVTPNFVVGIAAGYAGTSADLTNGGDVSVNGGKLGVYATFFQNAVGAAGPTGKETKDVQTPVSLGGGFYADVAVNGGYNSYDTERSALQGTARGSTDGGELNVLVGAGYDWKIGALTIGPTATYQYSLVGINSFTETGSLAPLNISNRNAESIRTTLGFKASYDWKVGGVLVRPEIRAAWQHEYGDSSYGLDASFANGAGGSFLVNGPEIGRDSLLIGAGVAIQCSDRFSTYLYYDGELGRSNYDRHGVSGGVRVSF